MRSICLVAALLVGANTVLAETTIQDFDRCLTAALDKRPGQVVKVEYKIEDKRHVYEFDIRGRDGFNWDVECLKNTGDIVEIEREVEYANHPEFKEKVKFSEKDARDIALAKFSGEIVEVEYELESDGRVSYEFDIDTLNDGEIKIEIDATTGEVVEINSEIWQVGLE